MWLTYLSFPKVAYEYVKSLTIPDQETYTKLLIDVSEVKQYLFC